MFRLNNKTRKYQTPSVKVAQMALESNFCQTGRVNAQADETQHLYHVDGASVSDEPEQLYLEF